MESILLKQPEGMTLVEYFNTLNIFEKRQLLNELSDVKLSIDGRLSSYKKVVAFVMIVSVVGFMSLPGLYSGIYFGSINLIMLFFLLKNTHQSNKFKFVINHLTSML